MLRYSTQVVVVGAGPVGMVLALDLASRGVRVVLVERRTETAEPAGRCNHISARSLEILRRLGLANQVREAGLPNDYPHDVAYATSMVGRELTRIRIPSRRDRFSNGDYADSGWPTPEPPHRCNQIFFDPVLRQRLRETTEITLLFDTEITAVSQDSDGARASGFNGAQNVAVELQCDYIVGCEGATSLVRKAIGAEFKGDSYISQTRSIMVRSANLRDRATISQAWQTWFIGNPVFGCLIALNGADLWMFVLWLPKGMTDFDEFDTDAAIREAFGTDLDYSVVATDDWYGRRMVANRFRDRRLMICGDAAHIWIPFAGYGMNAGIADAATLAWQLAGVLHGWGGQRLLDAYEAERQPVTEQVSNQAMTIAMSTLKTDFVGRMVETLAADGEESDKARQMVGEELYRNNVGQFAAIGLNFGTYYEDSPIIAHISEKPPSYSLGSYQPSTVPGCRTPHFWLDNDTSLYDAMGDGFALLRFDPTVDTMALLTAADQRGVPIKLIDISCDAGSAYQTALVLSRPDQHVAWRGNEVPNDAIALIDRIRGCLPLTKSPPADPVQFSKVG